MTAKFLLTGLLAITVSACTPQAISGLSYSQPKAKLIKGETVVDKPYNQVWDNLQKKLSGKKYKVLEADKKAGTITVSLKTDEPEHYVDCGSAEGFFTKGDITQKVNYRIAANYANLGVAPPRQANRTSTDYVIVDRETSLAATAEVQLSPEKGNQQTRVRVKSAYPWKYKAKGKIYREGMTGRTTVLGVIDHTEEVKFTTNSSGKGMMEGIEGAFSCMPTGKFEREIMEKVK